MTGVTKRGREGRSRSHEAFATGATGDVGGVLPPYVPVGAAIGGPAPDRTGRTYTAPEPSVALTAFRPSLISRANLVPIR